MADQRQKCSHPGCNCPVQNGDSFCSDQCRKQSQNAGESCQCGHPGCGDHH